MSSTVEYTYAFLWGVIICIIPQLYFHNSDKQWIFFFWVWYSVVNSHKVLLDTEVKVAI